MPGTALESLGHVSLPAAGATERVVLRRPPDLPGVELWTVTDSSRLWTVYHTSFAFCATERMTGAQAWKYRRRDYAMSAQSTMALEPGEMHVTTRISTADFHVVMVEPTALYNHLDDELAALGRPHFRVGQIDDGGLVMLFSRLWRSIEDPAAGTLERQHHLRRFLIRILRRAGERAPSPPAFGCERAVRRACQLVEERYASNPGLGEIAAAAGVSKYHLEHAFKARTGLAIHQYLKRVRVGRAMQLIRAGLLQLGDIAQLVGFSDQAHMTRDLRAQVGFTPGRLWQMYRPSGPVRRRG